MADTKPRRTRRQRQMDRTIKLSFNREVNRLAEIVRSCDDLLATIRQYRHDHPPGHRCPCCNYIRARDASPPNLFDFLTAIQTTLFGVSCVEEDRPLGRSDFEEMRASDADFLAAYTGGS